MQSHFLEPDGGIPNSRLPLVFLAGGLPLERRSGAEACALFEWNGWGGTWVDTVYPFWHFHTRGHEVLACVSGTALIGFGGDSGIKVEVGRGDACLIPAGVGHRRFEASADFQMAGGYPPDQEGDIVRPGEIAVEAAVSRIAELALPTTDPIESETGGMVAVWQGIGLN